MLFVNGNQIMRLKKFHILSIVYFKIIHKKALIGLLVLAAVRAHSIIYLFQLNQTPTTASFAIKFN